MSIFRLPHSKTLKMASILAFTPFLTACDWVVMNPSGDIATQQRDLILISTGLMLLIIIPVIIATLVFAWQYRASNTKARYEPDWHHSTRLELLIWSAPLAIIIVLGTITWISTHQLDPYRPIDRLDAERALPADVEPLVVEVVAIDWKWLFIYPQYGVASINELAAPVDRPIAFRITSSRVMNSFFIPALAGQIYAMSGMQTQLHAVINKEGVYDGFSANYSGKGFSHMRFKFHGVSETGFEDWIATVRASDDRLDRGRYIDIEKPSEREPVQYFAAVEPDLFAAIRDLCVREGSVCMHDMMQHDTARASGLGAFESGRLLMVAQESFCMNELPEGLTVAAMEQAAADLFPMAAPAL